MLAAASLGDHEKASEAHVQLMELKFPYVAAHRRKFEEDASDFLKKMRGVGIRFRAASRDPAVDEQMLRQASRR